MKSSGVIRPVDKMGRVVIPREIRRQLNIENDKDSFEIYMENGYVVMKKFVPGCMFCGTMIDVIDYENHTICKNCIDKLNELKNSEE